MKKITILLLMLTGALNAQTYCSISTDNAGVEPITSVTFGTTSIVNTNTTSIYVDKISTVAEVTSSQQYVLTVKGDSQGAFDNEYVAYVDWNHNGTLNDAGEVFYIGLINNSNGTDTKSATTTITVPASATIGNTRIRIIKVYTDTMDDYILNLDPCYISVEDVYSGPVGNYSGSYGQALDFTLNVSSLNRDAFAKDAFVVYPIPTSDVLKIDTNETIDGVTVYNLQGQLVLESKSTKELNVQNLASGQYLIKFTSGELSQVKKFVKI